MERDRLTKNKMFRKRVRYYIFYPEELELTVEVVKEAFKQAREYLADIDRFENESPARVGGET